MAGNRKLGLDESCGNPANVTNKERFSTAKWYDIDTMYHILGDSMTSPKGLGDTVWPLLCCAMHVWLKENEVQHALIVDAHRLPWVNHEAYYGYWMVALCLHLCWARERWISSLFCSLCMQVQVDIAVELATKLHVCMD